MTHSCQFINFLFNIYYSPDDSNTNSGDGLTANDIIEELKIDDVDDPDPDDKDENEEVEDKEEKEDKEDDKEEIELEDDDEDKEEELELALPVSKKVILKKYPKLFEEFPALERSYYRDQQFVELLGTVKDAREIKAQAEELESIKQDVFSGDIGGILKAVAATDENTFNKIADNYLETIGKVSEKAYYNICGNVVKKVLVSMVNEARTSKDENLEAAAQIINRFVFGNSEFKAPAKLAKEEPVKDDKLAKEREEFERSRFESVHSELSEKVDNTIKSAIEANIDKDNRMSPFVKRYAIKEAMEKLEELISSDKNFRRYLDDRWTDARKSNYSPDAKAKITKAYLGKAKTLLPDVIRLARNSALKNDTSRRDKEKDRKGPLPIGRNSTSSNNKSGHNDKGNNIPKNMKTLDYLNSD